MCPNSILKRLFTFLRILSGLHTHIHHIQTYIRVCNETFYSKVFQIYICCNNTESVEKSRQSEIMGICVRLPLHRFSIRWKKALDTEKKEQITILDLRVFCCFCGVCTYLHKFIMNLYEKYSLSYQYKSNNKRTQTTEK